MANIMNMTQLQNKPSRNGFDLSTRTAFTSNTGEILPRGIWPIQPGDTLDVDLASFTRTSPVQTAAMTRIKEYYEFIYVPGNLLWNQFFTWVSQMTKNRQTAPQFTSMSPLNDDSPYFTLFQLLNIYAQMKDTQKVNFMGVNSAHAMRKLLWYLGYGDMEYYLENGYNYQAGETANLAKFANPRLNPFLLLAYHKAYSDWHRNSQWENTDPRSFNINYIAQPGQLNIDLFGASTQYGNIFMDLHYANWEKDLFMGLLPSSQFGNSASVDLSSLLSASPSYANIGELLVNNQGDLVSSSINPPVDGYYNRVRAGELNASFKISPNAVTNIANSIGLTPEKLQSTFTILALRKAEAEQKFREITQSVHQDYQSQIEAHWDEHVHDAYSERSQWVAGFDATMDINEVVNQNLTSDNAADIQGKSTGALQGKFRFENKSNTHGFLICLYHNKPRLDYAFRSRLSKLVTSTTVYDYAIPEFDKIGMDAVPTIELFNNKTIVQQDILGYAPRYYSYKTDIDTVVGGFVVGGLNDWVAPLSEDYLANYLDNNQGNWSWPIMKVNPAILNQIFTFDAGKEDFTQEHFRTLASFNIHAVRKLDRDGLPY